MAVVFFLKNKGDVVVDESQYHTNQGNIFLCALQYSGIVFVYDVQRRESFEWVRTELSQRSWVSVQR